MHLWQTIKSVSSLTHIAKALAVKNHAEIIFLHVNEIKEGSPLAVEASDSERAKPLFETAENVIGDSDIKVRSIITVSHRISEGIVHTALEEDANFIIVGRDKNPNFIERFFSSIIDSVIQRFTGEVAVLHGSFKKENIKTILIPFSIDIHAILATEIAPAFVDYFNCNLKILLVHEPGTSSEERENREQTIKGINTRE